MSWQTASSLSLLLASWNMTSAINIVLLFRLQSWILRFFAPTFRLKVENRGAGPIPFTSHLIYLCVRGQQNFQSFVFKNYNLRLGFVSLCAVVCACASCAGAASLLPGEPRRSPRRSPLDQCAPRQAPVLDEPSYQSCLFFFF